MEEPRALRISRSLHWAQTPGHWQVGHWPLLGLTGWLRLCPVLSAIGPSVTQIGCCSRFSLCPNQMICNYLNLEQKVARVLQRSPVVPHSDLPAPSPSVHCVPRAEPAAPRPLQVEPQLHGLSLGISQGKSPRGSPLLPPGHLLSRRVQVGLEFGCAEAIENCGALAQKHCPPGVGSREEDEWGSDTWLRYLSEMFVSVRYSPVLGVHCS